MKAAICYEFGQPLAIDDLTLDPPQHGEVTVRIVAAAICHSDVHLIRGEWGGTPPVVAGHEAAGVVEAIGEGVTLVQPGDHVVVSLLRCCGRCFYCTTGTPHFCAGAFALAEQSRLRTKDGAPVGQGLRTSAFAEYTVVDQSQVVCVPDDLPLDCAALLACGVITGVGAVINTAQVRPGSSVVVIGTGGVGLNAVQGAALAGAQPIIAVDMLDVKLAAARSFGATHALPATSEDLPGAVRELTDGRGADYVFVTVGHPAAAAQAMGLTGSGGMAVIVGIPGQGATLSVPIRDFVVGGQRLVGSLMGSTRLSVDVPRLVALYRQGRLKLDELITGRYALEDINAAIEHMETGQALRNVLMIGAA